jgi:hypothetical protein
MNTAPADIDAILAQDEEHFLRHCKVEFYKSGGPGGQKRNKTSSAAKITHVPTGIEAHSNDFRSQAENRARSLHRLRFRIAAELRTRIDIMSYEPPAWLRAYTPGTPDAPRRIHVNPKNVDFARVAAHVLDVINGVDGNVPRAAALLGVSSSSLAKWLRLERTIYDAYAGIRRANGLPVDPFAR